VSLYIVQKFFYDANRSAEIQQRYRDAGATRQALIAEYELTEDERRAIAEGDIGMLYVLGCNGQLLMHFAGLLGVPWADYLESMREGVRKYGPVRAGIYAMTTSTNDKVTGV